MVAQTLSRPQGERRGQDPQLHSLRLGSFSRPVPSLSLAVCSTGSETRWPAVAGWGDAQAAPSRVYGNICDLWLWTWLGKATAASWQWKTWQQVLTSIHCHFENRTDFSINQYSLSDVGQAQGIRGDICEGSVWSWPQSLGWPPGFSVLWLFWEAWKAERGARTIHYREMWFNLMQGKTVFMVTAI